MEPQVKRVRQLWWSEDGGEHLDLEVEEVERMAELEESMRSALMSTLPVLKSKVELFSKLKEGELKEKVEKLENCLAEKERDLKQVKRKELRLLTARNSAAQKDLASAKKIEINNKSEIKTMKAKVEMLENEVAEKDRALKNIEGKYDNLNKEIKEYKKLFVLSKSKESKKEDELEMLKVLNSKLQEDLNCAKTLQLCKELDDQIQLKAMRDDIEKLEIEKTRSEKRAKEAHITITKNLEKIRQLEAKNNRLENEKSFEKGLVQTSRSEQNTKLIKYENIEQDLIPKEEYMENTNDEKESLVSFETQSENKDEGECLNFKKGNWSLRLKKGF